MAPDFAAIPIEEAEHRAVPIVVTTGVLEESRRLVEEFDIRCVVLQEQMELLLRVAVFER